MPYKPLPWRVLSFPSGPGSMPVDVQDDFAGMGFYGGFEETMREYNPNYPTSFVNFNGFPYETQGMYGGFYEGYLQQPALPRKKVGGG